jgi:hypothetical protein
MIAKRLSENDVMESRGTEYSDLSSKPASSRAFKMLSSSSSISTCGGNVDTKTSQGFTHAWDNTENKLEFGSTLRCQEQLGGEATWW